MASVLEVNGTRIFVDERGPASGPAVLYVHGGPGHSCWDFMNAVGDRLAARGLRVIGVDQRGVLRSDALPDGIRPEIGTIIEDFEAVRRVLGIDAWTLIGHSSGGAIALDYALAHPEHVTGLVLDNACLDMDATDRVRLPIAADLLDGIGETDAARRCRALAAQEARITVEERSWELPLKLGERYLELFFFDEAGVRHYRGVSASAPDELDWGRGATHLALLEDMYLDRRPALTGLAVPSMLVHGEADLVAAPPVIAAFAAATGGAVHTIPRAGHFAYLEQPEAYADAITAFVQEPATSAG